MMMVILYYNNHNDDDNTYNYVIHTHTSSLTYNTHTLLVHD